MVQVDVVCGSVIAVQTDGVGDDERDGFCFGLPYRPGGCNSPFRFMQHLVGKLMHQGGELFGGWLAGKDGDAFAVAHAQGGCNGLLELQHDVLCGDVVDESFPVDTHITSDLSPDGRKLRSLRLRDIEHVCGTEADQYRLVGDGRVCCPFIVLALPGADHRCEDADALLAFSYLASKLVPCVHTGDTGRGRHLPRDLQDVAQGVAVEPSHGGEVIGKRFRVSRL